VNIASIAGVVPLSRALSYSDAKAALASFTKWLAVELSREIGPEVRVNAVAPGFALTQQNRFLLEDEDGTLTDRGRQVLANVPMRRFGTAAEIASLVVFLCSPRTSFITGGVYPVDGGYLATAGV
jgi:NAD(P)-dependent dehydrogenase (short-subunit alcohol dehydrogenase family)